MAGIVVFRSLNEALREGFEAFDRMPKGYLVRRQMPSGWALALAIEQPSPREAASPSLASPPSGAA